jgi:hypothetical protein
VEVHKEELCIGCNQLRWCVLLVPDHIPTLCLCMVCLADAMLALADREEE